MVLFYYVYIMYNNNKNNNNNNNIRASSFIINVVGSSISSNYGEGLSEIQGHREGVLSLTKSYLQHVRDNTLRVKI